MDLLKGIWLEELVCATTEVVNRVILEEALGRPGEDEDVDDSELTVLDPEVIDKDCTADCVDVACDVGLVR